MGENPFVGAAPIPRGGKLRGREDDVRELAWFVSAERIVWLHAVSGAGKTSLLQAGLATKLEERRFEVFFARVGLAPVEEVRNRYESSVLESLGADRHGTLAGFAENRKRTVIIFDQFEEVLTRDRADLDAKRNFFTALAEMLQRPGIWALFAVREDYLPAFHTYAQRLPAMMNHRYRLDLLSVRLAREAMVAIAGDGGREFEPEASERLAKELARDAGGEVGPWVEPVLLQVVCRGLWERLKNHDGKIGAGDVPSGIAVEEELVRYAGACIDEAAKGDRKTEREIRRWIAEKLISGNLRNQLLDANRDGAGLDLKVVEGLRRSRLIRPDERDGRLWYELSHDRLVQPVIASNGRWESQLHPAERQADLWRRNNRPDSLLLRGAELKEAERVLSREGFEGEFLAKSRAAANSRRRTLALASLAALFALGFAAAAALSYWNNKLARVTNAAMSNDVCLPLNLARDIARGGWTAPLPDIVPQLNQVISKAAPVAETNLDLRFASLSAKGNLLVLAHADRVVAYAWPEPGTTFLHAWTPGECTQITAIASNADGSVLAVGFSGSQTLQVAVLRDGETTSLTCQPAGSATEALAYAGETLHSAVSPSSSVAISPEGAVALGGDGSVTIAGRVLQSAGTQPLRRMAWKGKTLAATDREHLFLWNVSTAAASELKTGLTDIQAIALSADGSALAVAGLVQQTPQLQVWSLAAGQAPKLTTEIPLPGSAPFVGMEFPATNLVVTAEGNGKVRIRPLDRQALAAELDHAAAREQCSVAGR